jgi:hypothetical protein
VLRGWLCLCMTVCCWGCAGELKDPERFDFLIKHKDAGTKQADASTSGPPPAPACMTKLFSDKCGQSICHGGAMPQAGLDLISNGVAMRLVGKSSAVSGACKGKTLVAADGSGGLLLDKLSATPSCGGSMPVGATPGSIQGADLTCIKDWVDAVGGS